MAWKLRDGVATQNAAWCDGMWIVEKIGELPLLLFERNVSPREPASDEQRAGYDALTIW